MQAVIEYELVVCPTVFGPPLSRLVVAEGRLVVQEVISTVVHEGTRYELRNAKRMHGACYRCLQTCGEQLLQGVLAVAVERLHSV